MNRYFFRRQNTLNQHFIVVGIVVAISLLGLSLHNIIGYRVVAFMLLVGVSLIAMFFDIVPVLIAATLSTLIWDFFFIPPRFTLTVGTPEDRLLLLMYFVIATMPIESGHDILKHLREWYSNPVLIISVQSSEEDIVTALDNGADDYLVKTFRTGELLARIRSAIRKAASKANVPTVCFDDLSIDHANRIVKKNNEVVKHTATEYALLSLLSRNDGKVLTHRFLLKEVWGTHQQNESQYLRVFVAQLRKKIETDPNRPKYIITESGIGYRFIGNPTT